MKTIKEILKINKYHHIYKTILKIHVRMLIVQKKYHFNYNVKTF